MNFGEIVRNSLSLAWRNKSLWLLGLFSGALGFPFDLLSLDTSDSNPAVTALAGLPVQIDMSTIPTLFGILGGAGLVFFIVNCFTSAGLIEAIKRLSDGDSFRLGSSLRRASHCFWRVFALHAIAFVIEGVVGLIAGGIIFGALGGSLATGLLLLVLVGPITFYLLAMVSTAFILASCAVVINDCGVNQALSEGWRLFHAHRSTSLLVALIYLGLTIVATVVAVTVFDVLQGLVVATAVSFSSLTLAAIVALPVFLVVAVPVVGLPGVVLEAVYTLFYFRLREMPVAEEAAATAAM